MKCWCFKIFFMLFMTTVTTGPRSHNPTWLKHFLFGGKGGTFVLDTSWILILIPTNDKKNFFVNFTHYRKHVNCDGWWVRWATVSLMIWFIVTYFDCMPFLESLIAPRQPVHWILFIFFSSVSRWHHIESLLNGGVTITVNFWYKVCTFQSLRQLL